MNAFLTSPTSNPEDIQTAVDALQSRGILPVADNAKPRPDVFSARFPLVAARVKGRDVYIQSESDMLPSVKHHAARVFVIDGEVVSGQNITMYCVKAGDGEDVSDLLAQKGVEQMNALKAV